MENRKLAPVPGGLAHGLYQLKGRGELPEGRYHWHPPHRGPFMVPQRPQTETLKAAQGPGQPEEPVALAYPFCSLGRHAGEEGGGKSRGVGLLTKGAASKRSALGCRGGPKVLSFQNPF